MRGSLGRRSGLAREREVVRWKINPGAPSQGTCRHRSWESTVKIEEAGDVPGQDELVSSFSQRSLYRSSVMEIVGLRKKPERPPQKEEDSVEALIPPSETAKKPKEAQKLATPPGRKLATPPSRPTALESKTIRPKPKPPTKKQGKNFQLNIVSSGTNSLGEQFRPGDLVQVEVMGFVTNARITSFYQGKENGDVWASYAPAGEETWLGGCIQASRLSKASA